MNLFAAVDLNAPRLQVGIERLALLSKFKNDRVSVCLIKCDVGGITARRLFWFAIDDRNHESVCHGERRLAEDRIALELLTGASIDAAACIHLLPVHSEALC